MVEGSIRSPVFNHAARDGNAHARHAHHCDQRRARVEWHDTHPAIHDRFLEYHLCLAQGQILIHMTANKH